jgi:hypothetical protein
MKRFRLPLLIVIAALLSIAASVTTIPSGNTVLALYAGKKTVAAAATPEALVASNAYVVSVLIEPATSTQGACYVGVKGLENIQLPAAIPGYNLQGSVLNLKDLYIRVASNGDAVQFTALYR